jgi:hypothetical protein
MSDLQISDHTHIANSFLVRSCPNRPPATKLNNGLVAFRPKPFFVVSGGFVAQIVLKTFLPLPQPDSAYGFCLGYAKSGEAI